MCIVGCNDAAADEDDYDHDDDDDDHDHDHDDDAADDDDADAYADDDDDDVDVADDGDGGDDDADVDDDDCDNDDALWIFVDKFGPGKGPTRTIMVGPFWLVGHCTVVCKVLALKETNHSPSSKQVVNTINIGNMQSVAEIVIMMMMVMMMMMMMTTMMMTCDMPCQLPNGTSTCALQSLWCQM